jgi:hypothetical protein
MHDTGGSREDGRWVAYTELARIRGISKESAIRLVRRERWRKMPGNEAGGTVRVLVPDEWLKPLREEHPPADPTPIREVDPEDISRLTLGWEQAVTLARIRAEVAEARADRAEIRADRAEDDRREAEKRADLAIARADAQRERIETLQAELGQATQARQEVVDAAEAIRQADDARKALGRWARLRRAWRGE